MQVSPQPTWRLRLDVAHQFTIEAGYSQSLHAHDLREEPGKLNATWRDANTGLILLQPSFTDNRWYWLSNWRTLDDWTVNPAFWSAVERAPSDAGVTVSRYTTTILNSTATPGDMVLKDILKSTNFLLGQNADVTGSDILVWAKESNFTLDRDEGFVFHYRIHSDDRHRYGNVFAVAFGDIALHMGGNGVMRVFQYAADDTLTPTLIDSFELCDAGDFYNKDGYITVIPIPGYGFSIYHSLTAQRLGGRRSSAVTGAVRGHLVPIRRSDIDGPYVHDGGTVYIAILPATVFRQFRYTFGFKVIRYSTTVSGSFVGPVFDPGYQPTAVPGEVLPIKVPTSFSAFESVSAALKNAGNTAAWDPATDRQGRIAVVMGTTDAKHTPFLLGTYVRFNPVLATRNTTPITLSVDEGREQVDRVLSLEWTVDDTARMEGAASIYATSPELTRLIERGDATFLIERCDDPGAETPVWVTEPDAYGFAQVEPGVEVSIDAGGAYYFANLSFRGMRARFDEVHQLMPTAFDNVEIGGAINTILAACGFGPALSIASSLATLKLPGVPQGQNWRFAPRQGDSGEDIIASLMLFGRAQNREHIARYDWAGNGWRFIEKPRDLTDAQSWTLTPFVDEADLSARKVVIGHGIGSTVFSLTPRPPAANTLQAIGLSSTDPNTAKTVPSAPMVLTGSLTDPTSRGYLGRVRSARLIFAPVQDVDGVYGINAMARRAAAVILRHRSDMTLRGSDYVAAFVPGKRVKAIRSLTPQTLTRIDWRADLWLKRRTVALGKAGSIAPVITYTVSDMWESEMEG